jgi:hypothetical protein
MTYQVFLFAGLSLVTLRANEVRNLDFRRETLCVAKTATQKLGSCHVERSETSRVR